MKEYKRLTARNPKNNMAYLVNVNPNEQDVESEYPNTLKCIVDSFQRLADYEDSGLSPEQVKNLQYEIEQLRASYDILAGVINKAIGGERE